ncbi:hypothetical protein RHGRI_012017 [Rhododendron griersonianum]|uniref:Uncharacterized protein n=1 Tax=Rhododendron griersonianum TaxID=479676 RepID=A0AAV6KQ85_9ERIC|nr:hypothetical protein RHGRI_012017 [Rhododendron griersonianum]
MCGTHEVRCNCLQCPAFAGTCHMVTVFLSNVIPQSLNSHRPDQVYQVGKQILAKSMEWEFTVNNSTPKRRSSILVSWTPPPLHFFKLNMDGALDISNGYTSTGGLVRDSSGHWCGGFHRNMSATSWQSFRLLGTALIVLGFVSLFGVMFTFLVPEPNGKSLEELSGENEDNSVESTPDKQHA